MDNILIFTFFLLGIIIGSFLNVIIFRLNTHKTFGGKSICLSCEKCIYWYDLVPVFSFAILKGRCRNCKCKISFQYPLVELITGIIFALLFYKFSFVFHINSLFFALIFSYFTAIFSLFIILSVYDIRHKIIPDVLSLFIGIIAFLGLFLFDEHYFFYPHIPSLIDFSGILLALPFVLLWFFSKGKYMGLGDGKLIIGIGLFLGFYKGLIAIIFAFWIGALFGILFIILKKIKGLKTEIPFGPFLALGTLLSFFFEFNSFLLF